MTDERWQLAYAIYEAAAPLTELERQQYVYAATPDAEIAGKVFAMLDEMEKAGGLDVFPEPTYSADDGAIHPFNGLPKGAALGRFVITGLVGQGGMGRVYSAHDQELNREVALKVITRKAETSSSENIIREAQAASALSHPNIATVYEVIHSGPTVAIAMELVDGTSLRHFCGTAQPVKQVASWGVQIANALAAAHTRGIVHRDVKPENLMLRRDGYIKVLDFGLARQVGTDRLDDESAAGTLGYMSPEEVLQRPITTASDIFSLGVVLYELASGTNPFRGNSAGATTRLIQGFDLPPLPTHGKHVPRELDRAVRVMLSKSAANRPAAPASVNPRVPAALNSLLLAMLAKDPDKRPSAAEIASQLAEMSRPQTDRVRRFWLAALVASLVLIAAAGWFVSARRDSPQFANLIIQPLTSQAGWEASPAFSPDGKSIAFTWTERLDILPQLYVKQLNDSAPIKLTDSHSEGGLGAPVWSPDGKSIAFKRRNGASTAIFAVPSVGGNEKKLLDLGNPPLSLIDWSPDGRQLAFSDTLPQSELLAIYLFDFRTGKRRKLTSPPQDVAGDWDPKFSPDGRTVAFKRVSGFWADDIYTVPVTGGDVRRVTWERRGIWGHAWTADGKSLIVSCQRGGTIFGLWRFPLASPSRPERIIQGGVDAIKPAISWKTKRLTWVNETQDVNIYRISGTGGEPVRLIASTLRDQDAVYSPGGQIAFVSDRSGSKEIWLARADGTGQKRVTNFDGPDVGDLQWSPDGRRLTFYSRAQLHSDIFTLDCDPATMLCANPKRVVSGMKAEVPSWSANGEFLYFASDRTGRWEVWKQATSGGQPIQITHDGGYVAHESRDGKWLYFSKDFSKDRMDHIWRIAASSAGKVNSPEELVIGPPSNVETKGWALTRDEIIAIEPGVNGHPGALRAYQISSKRTRLISPSIEGFVDAHDYSVSVSSDSRWILYSQLDRSGGNVMVAENR